MMLPTSIDVDPHYSTRLTSIESKADIPKRWLDTPIEMLIDAHNFGYKIEPAPAPKLLIATCIEFRYALPVPAIYAYVIRRAGGRLIGSEFSVAYVLSRGVEHIALVGHNDCGMTKVKACTPDMINALVNQGWHKDRAAEYVAYQGARYAVADEIDSLKHEYIRLKRLFRKVEIAPLFVNLADCKLYLPKWYEELQQEKLSESVTDEELLTLY